MTAALAYEWTRIRTIRSTYWLSAIALVFGVGLSFLVSMGPHFSLGSANPPAASEPEGLGQGIATQFAVFGVPYFVAYVLAMIACSRWGHEYRHGMIRATLTALSSRTAAWTAKFLVVGAWVVVVALVTVLTSLLVGWLWLHGDGVPVFTADVGARSPARCSTRCCSPGWPRRSPRWCATRPPRWCCCSCGRWPSRTWSRWCSRWCPRCATTRRSRGSCRSTPAAGSSARCPAPTVAFGSPLSVSAPSSSSAG